LVSLQRGIEWIQSISTTPQKGTLRQIKPFVKKVNVVLERILQGVKFEVTTTDILLMAIIVLLIASLLEASERPAIQYVERKVKNEKKTD
jgi:hypothetical protein